MQRDENGRWINWTPEDRDGAGKQYYDFLKMSSGPPGLGFLHPLWEDLPEKTKEEWRAAGVNWVR